MKTQVPNSLPPAAGEAAHTPGPYYFDETLAIGGYWRTDVRNEKTSERLCCVLKRDHLPKTTSAANAAFIVRACNAYDSDQRKIKALTEALEAMRGAVRNLTEEAQRDFSDDAWEQSRAALALGKEGQP